MQILMFFTFSVSHEAFLKYTYEDQVTLHSCEGSIGIVNILLLLLYSLLSEEQNVFL